MSVFKTATIATAALAALIGTAAAGDTTAHFRYSADKPVAETYASFQKTARQVCSPYYTSKSGTVRARDEAVKACSEMLVDKAVTATKSERLTAYHRANTAPATVQDKRFAGLK